MGISLKSTFIINKLKAIAINKDLTANDLMDVASLTLCRKKTEVKDIIEKRIDVLSREEAEENEETNKAYLNGQLVAYKHIFKILED